MQQNYLGRWALWDTCILLCLLLLTPGSICRTQETYELTHRTCNMQMGSAEAVAYGEDGTIFLLGGDGGLWAFRRGEEGFSPLAYSPVPSDFEHMALGRDGIVYLSGQWGQLTAYAYAGGTFERIAYSKTRWEQNGIAVNRDGTVFIASGHAGLIALRRNGRDFIRVAQTSDGGVASAVAVGPDDLVYLGCGSGAVLNAYYFDGSALTRIGKTNTGAVNPSDIAIGPHGTIYLSDRDGGVTAYAFDNRDLREIARIKYHGTCLAVAAAANGIVYLANADEGLSAYTCDGKTFHLAGHWKCPTSDARDVAVDEKGIVILASGRDGLRAICCDPTRSECLAHCSMGGEARSVAVGPDGTIFLANGSDGLRAYHPSEPFLSTLAWTNENPPDAVNARAVAVDWLGRVILAHERSLSIYLFTGTTFRRIAQHLTIGDVYDIEVTTEGWIYLACGEDGLQVLQYDGIELRHVTAIDDGGFAIEVSAADDGSVYLATGEDGLRGYRWTGGVLRHSAHLPGEELYSNWMQGVAAGPGNTVFLANGQDGIRAYSMTDDAFVPLAHLEMPRGGYFLGATTITYGLGGTIFFGYDAYPGMECNGLYACTFDGSDFRIIAHVNDVDFATDIALSPDGMVYLADGGGGLQGYLHAVTARGPRPVADRAEIDFGYVDIGEVQLQQVEISNLGNAPLIMREQSIMHFGRTAFSIAYALPERIEAGERARIGILCHPMTTGMQQATLILGTDDRDDAELQIPLEAFVMGDIADGPVPPDTKLEQNVPNPFNPSTVIRFHIPTDEHARLRVFDLTGRCIATLIDGPLSAGWHTSRFDAHAFASGTYLYTLETGRGVETRRMILMK